MLVVEAELLPPAGIRPAALVIITERSAVRFTDAAGHANVKPEFT
jgi:hypothetical protein